MTIKEIECSLDWSKRELSDCENSHCVRHNDECITGDHVAAKTLIHLHTQNKHLEATMAVYLEALLKFKQMEDLLDANDLIRKENKWATHALISGAGSKFLEKLKLAEKRLEIFTCQKCTAKESCEFAFDTYNTNGDCLAEK